MKPGDRCMTTEGSDIPDQPDADQPEKLDLRSLDIAEERQEELLSIFPEVRTEGGKLDLDRLKLALGETVDVGKERYGMSWPGKADCFRTIQAPSLGTLRPCPEELSLIHISEPTRLGMISYAVFCLKNK